MGFKSKPVSVGTTDTDVYQMSTGLSGAVVLGIGNQTGGALTYTLKFYKQSTAATTTLVTTRSAAANSFAKLEIPIALEAGDKIIMSASGSGIVAFATVTDSASASVATGWTPRGDYDSGATYAQNDVVAATDGNSYISMVSGNINNDPTSSPTYWMVNALRGVPGAMTGPASSVDGEIAIFNGTAGTALKRASVSGILKATSGVLAAAAAGTDYQAPIGTISGVAKGNGANALTAATAGADYVAPGTATAFTKQQSFTLATLTDGATINWDVSGAQKAKVTLGGNRTMAAVTNAVEGTTYFLWVIQDATGSRTLTWTTTGAGSFDFGSSAVPTLTTGANKADLLCFEALSIGGTLKLRYVGMKQGYS